MPGRRNSIQRFGQVQAVGRSVGGKELQVMTVKVAMPAQADGDDDRQASA